MAAVLPAGGVPRLGERGAVAIVAAIHLLLFAALSLALRSVTPPPPPDEGVPVEIVSARDAKAAVAPAPPPATEPSPAAEPIPEQAAPPPVVAPESSKPEKAPAKAEARPLDEAAPPAKVKPKPDTPKPAEPKLDKPKPDAKPLDTDALSKLLAKDVPKHSRTKPLDTAALSKSLDSAVPKTKPLDTTALSKSLDAVLPKAAALPKRGDPRVAAGLAAAIKAQVTPCWTLPAGGGTGKVTVLLHLAINRDGSIAGRPGLVSQTGVTAGNAAYARAFAEAAARAVLRCAPLKLPADQYDAWKVVEINFDPGEL